MGKRKCGSKSSSNNVNNISRTVRERWYQEITTNPCTKTKKRNDDGSSLETQGNLLVRYQNHRDKETIASPTNTTCCWFWAKRRTTRRKSERHGTFPKISTRTRQRPGCFFFCVRTRLRRRPTTSCETAKTKQSSRSKCFFYIGTFDGSVDDCGKDNCHGSFRILQRPLWTSDWRISTVICVFVCSKQRRKKEEETKRRDL
mmetsp:Transcript_25021/g.46677  ORF Transcript_25021/g.46677 Transcript_25021/m.46677 type:complete len:201 (-) Transcript_25021:1082-1684(-)